MVGSGLRCLFVCLHVGQLLAHRDQVSRPHVARGPLIAGIRSPAGVKGWFGHSPGERGRLAIRQPPGKSPAQAPGPQDFPAHIVSEELGELREVWTMGNRTVLWVAGWASVSRQVPRDPVQMV